MEWRKKSRAQIDSVINSRGSQIQIFVKFKFYRWQL